MIQAEHIKALRALLANGHVADQDHALAPILQGIAHQVVDGWVMGQALLAQRTRLDQDQEFTLALAGLIPETRQHWLAVMAARCKEAGQLQDGQLLQQYVGDLQGAAAWVEAALPAATLTTGPNAAHERLLLGHSVEQQAAPLMLARILASCHALEQIRRPQLPPIAAIDASGIQASNNWCQGRLLCLPGHAGAAGFLLSGTTASGPQTGPHAEMAWVLANPWLLLMAMVTFAQDAWAAERNGGILLELAPGQNAFAPDAIKLLVHGQDGDETACGTLADLILACLAQLGIQCFPHTPTAAALNGQLAAIVGQLLRNKIWSYRDGPSGQNGRYQIHRQFADACYRLPGSKVFNRTGRPLWHAVRTSAEALRNGRRNGPLGHTLDGEQL